MHSNTATLYQTLQHPTTRLETKKNLMREGQTPEIDRRRQQHREVTCIIWMIPKTKVVSGIV